MRRPNFVGWVSRELKYLSGEDTLNLRRLAWLAQGKTPRLRERVVLYAIATKRIEKLRSYIYDETWMDELDIVEKNLQPGDFNDLDDTEMNRLPDRYRKAIKSYQVAYNKINVRNSSKHMRWGKTVKLQKMKGVSNADIYRGLDLDAGNINAYLKNGDIDRVSLSTATEIMNHLMAL
jgi:hypothetical protein